MFSSLNVCNILKISFRQLQYLVYDCDILQPKIIGHDWYFDFNDLIAIKVCYKIKKAGFALNKLKNAKNFFIENALENTFLNKYLVVCEKTLYLWDKFLTGKYLASISSENERQIKVTIIDLDEIVNELLPFKCFNRR